MEVAPPEPPGRTTLSNCAAEAWIPPSPVSREELAASTRVDLELCLEVASVIGTFRAFEDVDFLDFVFPPEVELSGLSVVEDAFRSRNNSLRVALNVTFRHVSSDHFLQVSHLAKLEHPSHVRQEPWSS